MPRKVPAPKALTLILQQDSVSIDYVDPVDAWAEYLAGDFGDLYATALARYPNARRKAICINADEDGDILDVESGDAGVEDYVGWHRRQVARGVKLPGPYAAVDNMETIISLAAEAGIGLNEMAIWTANPDNVPELTGVPAGTRAKQFNWNYQDRNLDASVCLPSFWGNASPKPGPGKNPLHYEWYAPHQRVVVKLYDKYRRQQTPTKHPHKAKLATLRLALKGMAHVVYVRAHAQKKPNGRPGWNIRHRGFKFQHLTIRSNGGRVAK